MEIVRLHYALLVKVIYLADLNKTKQKTTKTKNTKNKQRKKGTRVQQIQPFLIYSSVFVVVVVLFCFVFCFVLFLLSIGL